MSGCEEEVEMSIRCFVDVLKEKLARKDQSWLQEFVDYRQQTRWRIQTLTSSHGVKDRGVVWKRRGAKDLA